ncbi:hypothetical protein JYU34_008379 [Plutella xylostella]|uniref:Uncharacterized protein n=1 Tax=Plutella xylostella TaxID=51655 RepID=A0ABQ7QLB6_PLUXY|nr:hypothetical protein JYU34_008379 [Plutella xylostella]
MIFFMVQYYFILVVFKIYRLVPLPALAALDPALDALEPDLDALEPALAALKPAQAALLL